MQLQPVSFKKTLNRAYRLLKPSREEISLFKTSLIRLLERIDHEESEENVKGHLRDFLNDTSYRKFWSKKTKETIPKQWKRKLIN